MLDPVAEVLSRHNAEIKEEKQQREIESRQKEIEYSAFMKWQDAGYPPGDGKEFWLAAEQEWEDKRQQFEARLQIIAECGQMSGGLRPNTHPVEEKKKEEKKPEKKKKEVAPSANHPQTPLQSEEPKKTRPWFCQSLLERLFPILAKSRSDTLQSKDCEKSQEATT